jgi:hypothetical protein
MKANGIRTIIIRGVLLVLLSLYFLVVFGQKSPNLVSFDVSYKAENISLQWLLSPSNNLSTVVIEKKLTDNSFQPIAEFWVNFDGNKECNFQFIDKKAKNKGTRYRLKLVTDKGEVQYSDIVSSSAKSLKKETGQIIITANENRVAAESLLPGSSKTQLTENLKSLLILRLQERDVNYL